MTTNASTSLEEAMRRYFSSVASSISEHPSIETLKAVASRPFDRGLGENSALVDHLALCPDCTALLASLRASESTEIVPAVHLESAWQIIRGHLQEPDVVWTPLSSLLEARPLAIDTRIGLCTSVAQSLASLHGAGQVVSYLSPDTILMNPGGRRARMMEPELGLSWVGSERHSVRVEFFAPEQIEGQCADGLSNLFSFGILMYRALCGVTPFRGKSAVEVAGQIVALDAPPMSRICRDIPPEVSGLTERLLQKDRSKRPYSASAVAAALQAIASGDEDPLYYLEDRANHLEKQIESLYEELDKLNSISRLRPGDSTVEERIDKAMGELRQLQREEAKVFRARFEASLEEPIDAGEQILKRVEELKQRFAGSTSTHRASGQGT